MEFITILGAVLIALALSQIGWDVWLRRHSFRWYMKWWVWRRAKQLRSDGWDVRVSGRGTGYIATHPAEPRRAS